MFGLWRESIWFYFLFGLAVAWGPRVGALVLALTVSTSSVQLVLELVGRHSYPFPASFMFSRYNIEFALGVGCAYLASERPRWLGVKVISVLGIAGVLLFAVTGFFEEQWLARFSGSVGVIPYGLASALIVLWAASSPPGSRPPRLATLLGDASYSICSVSFRHSVANVESHICSPPASSLRVYDDRDSNARSRCCRWGGVLLVGRAAYCGCCECQGRNALNRQGANFDSSRGGSRVPVALVSAKDCTTTFGRAGFLRSEAAEELDVDERLEEACDELQRREDLGEDLVPLGPGGLGDEDEVAGFEHEWTGFAAQHLLGVDDVEEGAVGAAADHADLLESALGVIGVVVAGGGEGLEEIETAVEERHVGAAGLAGAEDVDDLRDVVGHEDDVVVVQADVLAQVAAADQAVEVDR